MKQKQNGIYSGFLQSDHEEHESDKMMVVLKTEILKCFSPQITKDQLLLT